MPSRAGQRKSVLTGPLLPVPVSPIYGWFDSWSPILPEIKTWYWMIPNDGMNYKLCNFNHVNTLYGWHYAQVLFNSEVVFNSFNGYENIWRPTSANAPTLSFPDTVTVIIAAYPSYLHSHYWEIDFWREQIH